METKGAQKVECEVKAVQDLILDLVRTTENMGVVVGKTSYSQKTGSVLGVMNGSGRGLKLKPSSLSARPMIDLPVSRCERNSIMYLPLNFVMPALWTVWTG